MKKVTGIGGIFFKCADPKAMNAWYEEHLGIPVTDWGAMFEWREKDNPDREGYTVWSLFPADTNDFGPSTKDFRINYRVENIEGLVEELKNANVTVLDDIADSEYGKFVHILDPEGNSIELFEPPA
ncbi:MAG TPA: VOC family protein [Nitrolancea sp.]|jgi:lactoylglutathione lyase|nr:VOC family protein [Nitrolancea sp.]